MAGRHVGQVLQHPEREQLGRRRPAPAAEIEPAVNRADRDRCRPTRPTRKGSRRPQRPRPAARGRPASPAGRRRPGQIGRREGQLDVAAHHLQTLPRPDVLLRVEIGHLAADCRRRAGSTGMSSRRMPLRPSPRTAQNGSFPIPIGLTTPTPVITMFSGDAIPGKTLGAKFQFPILTSPNLADKIFPMRGYAFKPVGTVVSLDSSTPACEICSPCD